MTTRRRSRRSSRSATPRQKVFWVTNSIVPTTVTNGSQTITDLLSGATPLERNSLRRLTIKRLIARLSVKLATASAGVEFSYQFLELTEAAIAGGEIPEVGVNEVGAYLEADGQAHDADNNDDSWVKDYDIRTARHLRGSDRTMAFHFENVSAANNLQFSLSFRMLIAYG